jgi:hypothetical protein
MGVTTVPKTPQAMEALEAIMGSPLEARGASGKVFGLLNDDTLHDMLDLAARSGPDVDVRPLVALSLDEFVNWAGDASWPGDVRERGAALVSRFADAASLALVADILGIPRASAQERLDARRGTAPGTHAVRDAETGEIFRVEAVYGVVLGAAPEARDRLEAEIFASAPGPAA